MSYPEASLQKNDKKAHLLIWAVSAVVFIAVVVLHEFKIEVDLGFDPHVFALLNAVINGTVAVLLIFGLMLVKMKKFILHKKVMLLSIVLSVIFLLSYIAHHILADSTSYNNEGIIKTVYYFILVTHIVLAGLSLPYILYTAYRASIAEYQQHMKLARIIYPVWLYVAITGVVVYLMISPFYA